MEHDPQSRFGRRVGLLVARGRPQGPQSSTCIFKPHVEVTVCSHEPLHEEHFEVIEQPLSVSSDSTPRRSWGKLYHPPLEDEDSFRIFVLLPGSRNQPIEGLIVHVSVADKIPYEALSYVWGPEYPKKRIIVNDVACSVRENLVDALESLRHKSGPKSLWIDALCINQDDIAERNELVTRMNLTYRQAMRVVVWLGKSDENSVSIFRRLKQIGSWKQSESLSFSMNQLLGEGFLSLLKRPYWKRLWIIQEFISAQDLEICCGESRLAVPHLIDSMLFLENRAFESGYLKKAQIRLLLDFSPSDPSTIQQNPAHGGADLRQSLLASSQNMQALLGQPLWNEEKRSFYALDSLWTSCQSVQLAMSTCYPSAILRDVVIDVGTPFETDYHDRICSKYSEFLLKELETLLGEKISFGRSKNVKANTSNLPGSFGESSTGECCFFLTAHGMIGIASTQIQQGDLLCEMHLDYGLTVLIRPQQGSGSLTILGRAHTFINLSIEEYKNVEGIERITQECGLYQTFCCEMTAAEVLFLTRH
ncbi:heterokaryon incompatibility protein-domain-containing protein [Halenospora varia]|nr:heterokaryon incompatibility protein-domain-containing protein [Halenospora varia]